MSSSAHVCELCKSACAYCTLMTSVLFSKDHDSAVAFRGRCFRSRSVGAGVVEGGGEDEDMRCRCR